MKAHFVGPTEGEKRERRNRARAALERALHSAGARKYHVKLSLDINAARELLSLIYDRNGHELAQSMQGKAARE